MKQFSPKLFFVFSLVLFLSYCSDPVKVGGGSTEISINAAWMDEFTDQDTDGYYSYANIYFEVTTSEEIDVTFMVKYKISGTSSYSIYKETAEYPTSDTKTWFIALGDAGFEIPQGCYDFRIEVYSAGEMVASLSAEEESNISSFCMETTEEDQSQVMLHFNNECPTEVFINITGYGSITVPGKSQNTYNFNGNPGVISFTGETTIPDGGNLIWNDPPRTIDMTEYEEYTFRLWYGESIFYATLRNDGQSALTEFYVNYTLDDEFHFIHSYPNDGVTRPLGYYNAHPETEIWAWSIGAQDWYFWSELNFPGGDNQVITLSSNLPKVPGDIIQPVHKTGNTKLYIKAP
jgi:hypothetical protein